MIDLRTRRILEYDKIIMELSTYASSDIGREMCLLLEPVYEYEEIMYRQKTTDCAVKIIFEKSLPPLSGFVDIRQVLARAKTQSTLSCKDLMKIGQFLRAASKLKGFIPSSHEQFQANEVYQIMARISTIPTLDQSISHAIAGEAELFDHASQTLMNIRRKIKDTQAQVKIHLERIVKQNSKALQEQLVTMRGNRYVVPVRADHRSEVPGIVHDTSSSGATLFIEPYPVVEANNKIREYLSEERDEIERILIALSLEVYNYVGVLNENVKIAAFVDFIFAKAGYAVKINAMPPIINNEGKVKLISARHPLIQKDRVVPITIEIGFSFDTLVITGPNTGGKTVSLKTCGLFSLMAMSGLQIPAKENSIISIFKTIIADIGDEQSIEQNLSTFSSHMTNLVKIVDCAGPNTLVLVDELGSGTDPSEGAALAISILEYLASKKCTTIATTHYKELKLYAIRTPRVENACCEFDVETLQPTYKLLIGIPGVSNAFSISKKLGLPDFIINRARDFLSNEEVEFEKVIADTEQARKTAILVEQQTKLLLEEAKSEVEKAKHIRQEIEQKKKDIIFKSREEAREYMDDAYLEAQILIDEMKKTIKEQDILETKKQLEKLRSDIKSRRTLLENEIGKATLGSYKRDNDSIEIVIGDMYFTSALGISGMLVEGADSKGNCILLTGNKRVTVPVSSLRVFSDNTNENDKGSKNIRKKAMNTMTMSKKMTMSTEIKLLGMNVEEACEKLDKFIDDAVLTGISSLRVVHGKGTGALRQAITLQLRKDKRVKSFRLGEYGEGDSGVTIVML